MSHIHHLPPLYNGRLIAIDGRWGQITSQAMLYISFIVSKGILPLFSVFFWRNNCFEVFGLFLWKEVSHSPIWLPPTFNIREEKAKPTRAFLPLLSMEMGHEENRGRVNSSRFSQNMGGKIPKGLMPGMQWSAVQYSQRSPPSEPWHLLANISSEGSSPPGNDGKWQSTPLI